MLEWTSSGIKLLRQQVLDTWNYYWKSENHLYHVQCTFGLQLQYIWGKKWSNNLLCITHFSTKISGLNNGFNNWYKPSDMRLHFKLHSFCVLSLCGRLCAAQTFVTRACRLYLFLASSPFRKATYQRSRWKRRESRGTTWMLCRGIASKYCIFQDIWP